MAIQPVNGIKIHQFQTYGIPATVPANTPQAAASGLNQIETAKKEKNKKVLIGLGVVTALAAVTTAGILIYKNKTKKAVDTLQQAGNKAKDVAGDVVDTVGEKGKGTIIELSGNEKKYLDSLSAFQEGSGAEIKTSVFEDGRKKVEALKAISDGTQKQAVVFDKTGNATHNINFIYDENNKLVEYIANDGEGNFIKSLEREIRPVINPDTSDNIGSVIETKIRSSNLNRPGMGKIELRNADNKPVEVAITNPMQTLMQKFGYAEDGSLCCIKESDFTNGTVGDVLLKFPGVKPEKFDINSVFHQVADDLVTKTEAQNSTLSKIGWEEFY